MRSLAIAAVAVTLTAGTALAQAGGPLGAWGRHHGVDPWGRNLPPPGVVVVPGGPGVIVDDDDGLTTGTIVVPDRRSFLPPSERYRANDPW